MGRYIEPLLSLSIDFYCRVFVKVRTGQRKCKESTSKLGHVYQCFGCESLAFQPLGKTSLSKDGTNLKFSLPPPHWWPHLACSYSQYEICKGTPRLLALPSWNNRQTCGNAQYGAGRVGGCATLL